MTAEPIQTEDDEHLDNQNGRVGAAQVGLAGMGLWWHAREYSLCGLAAEASTQGNVWGVSASFTPRWTTPEGVKAVFLAEEVSLEGHDLRLGIVRGRAGSVVFRDGVRDVLERDVQITGAVLENDGAIVTIKRSVQIHKG